MNADNKNDKKSMITFREAFKGYNKDDVNKYLEQLYTRCSVNEAEYDRNTAKLNERIKKLAEAANASAAASDELVKVSSELKAVKEENERLKAEINEYERKKTDGEKAISDLGSAFEKAKNDLDTANAEKKLLLARIEELENASKDSACNADKQTGDAEETGMAPSGGKMAEKAELYDRMSAQIGNVLLIANNNADGIIDEANKKAEQIVSNAKKQAETIVGDATARSDALLEVLNTKIRGMSEKYIDEYSKIMNDIQNQFGTINENLASKANQLHGIVGTMKTEIGRELEEEFKNINAKSALVR